MESDISGLLNLPKFMILQGLGLLKSLTSGKIGGHKMGLELPKGDHLQGPIVQKSWSQIGPEPSQLWPPLYRQ